MRSGENRFNRPFLDALSGALDEVEGAGGPVALVTVGEDKFYSNGLDLAWLTGAGAAEGPAFLGRFLRLIDASCCSFSRRTFVNRPTASSTLSLVLRDQHRWMRVGSDAGLPVGFLWP
jgi:hypothetical protein